MPRKNQVDIAWTTAYEPHLNAGKQYRNDPNVSREMIIERMLTRVMTEMALNRFDWTGLPKSIDPRFLELTLFRYGLSVFYLEKNFGKFLALQGTPNGITNWEENPTSFHVIGNLMLAKTISRDNCVPIWSNYLRSPDLDIVQVYANRLANMDRTIEINSKNARRPRVAFTNENQALSMSNINRQIDEGAHVVTLSSEQYADNSIPLATADLGVDPDILEKMHIVRTREWGEAMGLLGFDFANQDKKERLVASEVDANNSQVDAIRMVNLNARRQACEQINDKYGLDVWVDFHITSETSAAVPVQGEQPVTDPIPMDNSQES